MSGIIIEYKGKRVEFGVDSFPYRKHKVLYMGRPGSIWPVAYFRNDEQASEFQEVINLLFEII